MERVGSIGRTFFAIGIAVFGIQHLVYGNFVTRVVPTWPAWIPGRAWWAYAVGAALIAAGGAMLLRVRTRAVALVLGSALLLSVVALYLPMWLPDLRNGRLWTMMFKTIALAGGAFAIARVARKPANRRGSDDTLLWAGRLGFGSFLILAGIQHVIYVNFVATLVPAWIPGGAVFWTIVAAVALMAGGVGIIVPRTSRLAALCTGGMILTWFFVLHLPRAVAELGYGSNEMTALFEALAMSGIAFVLAGAAAHKPVVR